MKKRDNRAFGARLYETYVGVYELLSEVQFTTLRYAAARCS